MTPERKIIIQRVREEGRQAARAGKHMQTNPYPTYSTNRYQWFRGYSQGTEEERKRKEERVVNQTAPEPTILRDLVSRLTYKPGWLFFLEDRDRGQGSRGLTLIIRITVLNSYHPEQVFNVVHYMIVPAASYNERSWRRWLLDQILLVEQHEACEFFQIDGQHVYGPNHAPGNDPYIIFDQGTKEDSLLNHLGK